MGRRRRMLMAPAVLALAVLAAACGGGASGDDGTGVASAGDGSARNSADKGKKDVDRQQAALDFARCMREHGVDMPDPQVGDSGGMFMIAPGAATPGSALSATPPAGFEEADKACRHHLEGLIQDGGGPVDPEQQDRALKFAQCMREQGIDMPDPDFSQGGVRIQIGGQGLDPTSEKMQAAHKACSQFFGPGGGVAPSTGTRS